MMTKEQKNQAVEIFGKIKRANSIDYVGAWYHKAAEYIQNTSITCAFVSTNSITQGEQVTPLWSKLLHEYNIHINFAYTTFRWDSESNSKAHVHCVIIGFGSTEKSHKVLYNNGTLRVASNINPYLIDAPSVLIESRAKPLADVPPMTAGNKPTDGGNFIFEENEYLKFISDYPQKKSLLRRYVGSQDFINGKPIRYCLWLKGIAPNMYRDNKEIIRRLDAIRVFRANSSAKPTRAKADYPMEFFSAPQKDGNILVIPEVSSERRRYIPIGFLCNGEIASNKLLIISDADMYLFGVLISNVHMAWMRVVSGRLEMRYQYSGAMVYNTFPWPTPTDKQRAAIEQTAQGILDARALYPDSSLADLYYPVTMPPELLKAHRANDKAVMQAYGFWGKLNSESECVAALMKMYEELVRKN